MHAYVHACVNVVVVRFFSVFIDLVGLVQCLLSSDRAHIAHPPRVGCDLLQHQSVPQSAARWTATVNLSDHGLPAQKKKEFIRLEGHMKPGRADERVRALCSFAFVLLC